MSSGVSGSSGANKLRLDLRAGAQLVGFEQADLAGALKRGRVALARACLSKTTTPKRVLIGWDSLSEGTPTTYAAQVYGNLGWTTSTQGTWLRLWTPVLTSVTGLTDAQVSGDAFSSTPRKYSLDSYCLYAAAAGGAAGFRTQPNNGSGSYDWKTARLFYLQQPGGGTFTIRQFSADGSTTAGINVNCDGAFGLTSVDLPRGGATQSYVEVVNGTGLLAFMGLLILQGTTATDGYVVRASLPGSNLVGQWNVLDKPTQQQWLTLLNIDLVMIATGVNDRFASDGPTFQTALTANISNISTSAQAPGVLIVEPAQTSDWAGSNSPAYVGVYKAVADALKVGYYSLQEQLGDYATLAAGTGYNAEGPPVIHPSTASNQAAGGLLAAMLGTTTPNAAAPGFSVNFHQDITAFRTDGGAAALNTPATVFTFGLRATNIHVCLEIDIAYKVSGNFAFVERRIELWFNSTTGGAVSTFQELANTVLRQYQNGTGLTNTLSYAIVGGNLQVNVTGNYAGNVYATVRNARVLNTPAIGDPLILVGKLL